DVGSVGRREYGDLRDQGRGVTITSAWPFRVRSLGNGRLAIGFDRQTKTRENFYRRFDFHLSDTAAVLSAPPPPLVGGRPHHGGPGTGWVDDVRLAVRAMDNYTAHQRVNAGFLSLDLPLGRRGRGNLGVRVEQGVQDVRSYDLFAPTTTTSSGRL